MQHFGKGPRGTAMGRRGFIKAGAAASTAAAVSALNASKLWAQGEAGRPLSIDLHTHWTPEPYVKALAEMADMSGLRRARPKKAEPNPLDFDLDKRRKWMDEHGVQMHVLTLDGGMPWQWVPPLVGVRLAQIVNDAAIEAHTAFPDRFTAAIEIPILGGFTETTDDPVLALKELNRVAGKPGMRAVHLPNSYEGNEYLFDPHFAPLLARCEELGYPILFHPLDGEVNIFSKERLGDPLSLSAGLNNSLGFPFETTLTVGRFIATGTLDKYPKLDIVLPHSGGIIPYIAGRIDHENSGGRRFKTDHTLMDYVRRFHYDSLTYYPETLHFLIDLVGADRVVIGSDTYAIMDVEQPNALVEQMNLPAEDRDLILRGNAARLLRL